MLCGMVSGEGSSGGSSATSGIPGGFGVGGSFLKCDGLVADVAFELDNGRLCGLGVSMLATGVSCGQKVFKTRRRRAS
jgi:hypothetical protein